jgi:hypothetical protein
MFNEANLLGNGESMSDDWKLMIALQRSPLVYMVKISQPLSPFQMLSLSLTTVLSFLGIWRLLIIFKSAESIFFLDFLSRESAQQATDEK